MPRRLQFSLANALLAVTCFALAIGWWWTVPRPPAYIFSNRPPTDAAIQSWPLTISMSEDSGWSPGWYFSVNSAGNGEMTIPDEPADITQAVKVSPAQLEELKGLLVREQFFALNEDYGQLVSDGGTQSLTITVGDRTHTVRIHFLGNWVAAHDTEKLQQPARALRVWMLIRSWFSHPQAANSLSYDQRVLDAVNDKSNIGD